MSKALTADALLSTLPEVLAEDDNMRALAESIANVLAGRRAEIDSISIYPRIDDLPDELLDILAYDFKVDWWEPTYSVEEKRETLKRSWYVHKHMGTPAAIKAALSAIYPGTTIEEWYEYNGQPYHFRLKIPVDQNTLDPAKHAKVMKLVEIYKNLRSVLDSVEYFGASGSTTYYASGAIVSIDVMSSGASADHE